MNVTTRELPAPESYATFWEAPVVVPPPAASPRKPADARDAYTEFVNVIEAEAPLPRTDRAA